MISCQIVVNATFEIAYCILQGKKRPDTQIIQNTTSLKMILTFKSD